ncbi:MAG TPA: hypothetical protein VNI34_08445 [Candidatus Nitrosotalea sp.]|nr:hypothetical protein [Candidatus Nitrosotalea sp.]
MLSRDRLLASLSVALLLLLALALHQADAPSGFGVRAAMAGLGDGSILLAQPQAGLVRIGPHTAQRLGGLPRGNALALITLQSRVLIAADSGLWLSPAPGGSWQRLIPGHFLALAGAGTQAWAGQWDGSLWHSTDAGRTWQLQTFPEARPQFESIAADSAGDAVVATLLGLYQLRSGVWSRVPQAGSRVTAVGLYSGGFEAGDWEGHLWRSTAGNWRRWGSVSAGVWALAGDAVATTGGLVVSGHLVPTLAGLEVTALVESGSADYAAAGPDRLYAGFGDRWRAVAV